MKISNAMTRNRWDVQRKTYCLLTYIRILQVVHTVFVFLWCKMDGQFNVNTLIFVLAAIQPSSGDGVEI